MHSTIGSLSSVAHVAATPRYLKRQSDGTTAANALESSGANAGVAVQLPRYLQAKLAVSNPGDALEQEADQMADRVMRMPDTQVQRQRVHNSDRMCASEQHVQNGEVVQPKAEVPAAAPTFADSTGLLAQTGMGQPLDRSARSYFEPRFGRDFSQVRVHVGQPAANLAYLVNANAFTLANNIVFGAGAYAPGTDTGRRLIAHELTHVVQQSGTAGSDQLSHRSAIPATGTLQRKVKMPAGTNLPTFEKVLKWDGDLLTADAPDRKQELQWEIFYSIFSSPRIFALAGKNNAALELSLMRHIRAREGIIEFAKRKQYHFEGGRANFRMNDKFWWWDTKTGKFGIKDDADSQEARDDLNEHPEEYYIGCAAATVITMKGGSHSDLMQVSTSDDQDWIPGDGGFIANDGWDGKAPGLEGENIIYMGGKRFWGHFQTEQSIKTFKEWIDLVKGWPNASARLDTKRDYPMAGLK